MRNEVDVWETTIIKEAEHWTTNIYLHDGRYFQEWDTVEEALTCVNDIAPKRALVYAVRRSNQALVAIYTTDGWELAKFRGIDHPLSHLIKEGKLIL